MGSKRGMSPFPSRALNQDEASANGDGSMHRPKRKTVPSDFSSKSSPLSSIYVPLGTLDSFLLTGSCSSILGEDLFYG